MKGIVNQLFFDIQKKPENRKKCRTVVKARTEIIENELKISEIIRQIPYFFLYFDPILSYRDFKVAEIDDERFEKCQTLNDSREYLLLKYDSREKTEGFHGFFKEPKKRKYMAKVINSYKHLLNITALLDERKIVHMNIVPQSILFRDDGTPFLTNFQQSFLLDETDFSRNPPFYDPRRIHLPLEYHILCYLVERDYASLSLANIETVVGDWFTSIYLSDIGKYCKKGLKEAALFSRMSLINKPKEEIIKELLAFSPTWNNYSLSIIYLHFLSSLDDIVYPHPFTFEFSELLMHNISNNCSKREGCAETLRQFDQILESTSDEDWDSLFSQL